MIKLREKLYTKGMAFSDRKETFTKEEFNKYFTPHAQSPFETLSTDTVLDFSRGYLLGLVLSDEQQTTSCLANIHPEKLDFDPKTDYMHGGFYHLSLGAFLYFFKALKYLTITSDFSFYTANPILMMRIYLIARVFSVIAALLGILMVYLIAKLLMDKKYAMFGAFMFSINPLLLVYSHQIKPHTFGIFLALAGVYCCAVFLARNDGKRSYLLPAVFFGLSTACVLSNGIFVLSIPLAEMISKIYRNEKYKSGNVILSMFVTVIVFLLMQPYVVTNFTRFYNGAIAHNIIGYEYGVFGIKNAAMFLYDVLRFGHNWILIPAVILGTVNLHKARKAENTFFLSIAAIFIFFAAFFMKHQGVFTLAMPFICIISAAGINLMINSSGAKKTAGHIYAVLIIVTFIASTAFYEQLFVQKGNLTNAGKWINENVPEKSTVGIPTGWALPGHFPAMEFLKYKTINFPIDVNMIEQNPGKYPQYLVLTKPFMFMSSISSIKNSYSEIKRFNAPGALLGIPFRNDYVPTENMDVLVLKKNGKTG